MFMGLGLLRKLEERSKVVEQKREAMHIEEKQNQRSKYYVRAQNSTPSIRDRVEDKVEHAKEYVQNKSNRYVPQKFQEDADTIKDLAGDVASSAWNTMQQAPTKTHDLIFGRVIPNKFVDGKPVKTRSLQSEAPVQMNKFFGSMNVFATGLSGGSYTPAKGKTRRTQGSVLASNVFIGKSFAHDIPGFIGYRVQGLPNPKPISVSVGGKKITIRDEKKKPGDNVQQQRGSIWDN